MRAHLPLESSPNNPVAHLSLGDRTKGGRKKTTVTFIFVSASGIASLSLSPLATLARDAERIDLDSGNCGAHSGRCSRERRREESHSVA